MLTILLARQRAEEPLTHVRWQEVPLAEQLEGLTQGRYDGGLALTNAPDTPLQAHALWQDELAVAMPANSPLCQFEAVPIREVARYPVIGWQGPACEPLSTVTETLLPAHASHRTRVNSHDLMTVLILAGYGIGIGLRSEIGSMDTQEIALRPLLDCRTAITTYLLRPRVEVVATAMDRLAERGQRIAH